jgi:hypothetical protein
MHTSRRTRAVVLANHARRLRDFHRPQNPGLLKAPMASQPVRFPTSLGSTGPVRYRILHHSNRSTWPPSAVGHAVPASENPVGRSSGWHPRSAPIVSPRYRIPKIVRTGKGRWQGNVGQGNRNGNPSPLSNIPLPSRKVTWRRPDDACRSSATGRQGKPCVPIHFGWRRCGSSSDGSQNRSSARRADSMRPAYSGTPIKSRDSHGSARKSKAYSVPSASRIR